MPDILQRCLLRELYRGQTRGYCTAVRPPHFTPILMEAALLRLKEWYRAPKALDELHIILDMHEEVRWAML